MRRLGSSNKATILAAVREINARLAKADLTLDDLADKLDSDPTVIWYPVAKLPAAVAAKMGRAA